MADASAEGRANQVVDQLLERYSTDWEQTPSRLFDTNFGALRNICHTSRLGSVTNIIIFGLGNGGTRQEQAQNANLTLDAYREYSQKIFFTQIAVARLMKDLLVERHRLQITIYARDPQFTADTISCLRHLGIVIIPPTEPRRAHIDRGSLIYDVTKLQDFVVRNIDFTWHGSRVPPAAILTCLTSLLRNRVAPRPGDPPKEVNPDFLRKYYMLPIMDLHTRTAPSSADRHRVDAIAHPIAQATARAGLREQESQLTQGGYEQMSVHHAAIMDDFVTRIQQRTAEYQQYYQAQQDWGRYHDAARLAEEEMTPLIPRNTNSYVFDPLMVLLYRKPEPTQ